MTETLITPNVLLSKVNELPVLRVQNQAACATIAIQGAHLFEYTPEGKANLIFISSEETFETSKPIRGGIPVCWPWFGPHKDIPSAPGHGFSRTEDWAYEVISDTDTRTDIKFTYSTSGDRETFPYRATVELLFSIGETLIASLTTTNTDDKPFSLNQALHTYFACENIDDVRVNGFGGQRFVDKLSTETFDLSEGFFFDKEVDGIVLDRGQPVSFTGLGHEDVHMTRKGSNSAVLWNPWIDKAKAIGDLADLDYKKMFCVETCNVLEDSRLIKPNASHALIMEISA